MTKTEDEQSFSVMQFADHSGSGILNERSVAITAISSFIVFTIFFLVCISFYIETERRISGSRVGERKKINHLRETTREISCCFSSQMLQSLLDNCEEEHITENEILLLIYYSPPQRRI